MIFRDETHMEAYSDLCGKLKRLDSYHKALAYLLALDEVLREHTPEIFDFETDCIKPDGLRRPWQTGTSICTTRLAFNLWNGFTGEDARDYTPEQLFSRTDYAPYYWESIKIRFELK